MSQATNEPVKLVLYVAGETPKSLAAIRNLEKICSEHLAGKYKVEILIDDKETFDEVRNFSSLHFTGIQKANVEAWARFAEAGVTVTRLSEDDVARFRQVAVPLWFKWANKDKDAARVFKLHLEVMQNPSVAYLTPDDIKNYELQL